MRGRIMVLHETVNFDNSGSSPDCAASVCFDVSPVYTVYKTTNIVNNKYYIGVHKTNNPEDEYVGSGKLINRAIKKYGIENFHKKVLFYYTEQKDAYKKESELVAECLSDPMCYNLKHGGQGGFDYVNANGFSALGGKRSGPTRSRRIAEDPEYRERLAAVSRKSLEHARKFWNPEVSRKTQRIAVEAWRGKHHSEEYKKNKSAEQSGSGNSHYGQVWINFNGSAKFVNKEELESYFDLGWQRGRVPHNSPERIKQVKEKKEARNRLRRIPKEKQRRKIVNWPDNDSLLKLVAEIGQRKAAKIIGVSNVAVHSRLKKLNLL